jgi:hypothetical protein
MDDIIRVGLQIDDKGGVRKTQRVNNELDKLARNGDRAGKSVKKTNRALSAMKLRMGALITGTVGLMALNRGFRAMAGAVQAGEQSAAKLNSVLKSTGHAAGRTAEQVNRLSTALSYNSLFNDDEIRAMTAQLATFKMIQGQVFDQTARAILDMAAVMDQDLRSTVIQVGKALNDPILGVTALRRVGVQLSEQQMEMVKSFMNVNDIAGAQAIILGELESQFGGAAAGANVGLTGAIKTASKEWDNFLEALGRTPRTASVLAAPFEMIANFLADIRPATTETEREFNKLVKLGARLEWLEGRPGYDPERLQELRGLVSEQHAVVRALEDKRRADESAAEAAAESARQDALAANRAKKRREELEKLLPLIRAGGMRQIEPWTPYSGLGGPANQARERMAVAGMAYRTPSEKFKTNIEQALGRIRQLDEPLRQFGEEGAQSLSNLERYGAYAFNSIAQMVAQGVSGGGALGVAQAGIGGAGMIAGAALGAGTPWGAAAMAGAGVVTAIIGSIFGGQKELPVRVNSYSPIALAEMRNNEQVVNFTAIIETGGVEVKRIMRQIRRLERRDGAVRISAGALGI